MRKYRLKAASFNGEIMVFFGDIDEKQLVVAKVQKCLCTAEALAVQHEKIERICWDKSGKGACEAGMATKKQPGKKSTQSVKKKTGKAPAAKPAADLAPEWSIFIFGAAVLVLALVFVKGASVWAWVRSNIIFGIFGVGAYVLGPILIYLALRVVVGLPIIKKSIKFFISILLLCGIFFAFSKTDPSGNFLQGIAQLHAQAAEKAWPMSGGVLGAVLGWSLTALCGRPAANILLVLMTGLWVMVLTQTTPAQLYHFLARHAQNARDIHTIQSAARQDKRIQQNAQRAERAEQIRQERKAQKESGMDMEAFAGAMAKKKRKNATIDIALDDEPTGSGMTNQEKEKPVIGPGGTFGMFAASGPDVTPVPPEPVRKLPARSNVQASSEVPAPVSAPAKPADTAGPLSVPQPNRALETLVRQAVDAEEEKRVQESTEKVAEPARDAGDGYVYPPLNLFHKAEPVDTQNMQEELMHNADLLVKTLESFGVKTKPLGISSGPSVTRYELQPLAGVKISRITGLADDIALNLATGGVRIEAPIPGKAAVGIEIPNKTRAMVTLRSILEAPSFAKSKAPLTFAVGKDIAGNCQVGNLAKMPHLLIAGTTGSGKSVCTNSIIMSMLYRCSPQVLRMILIDPKMVEFAQYNGIPHLLMPVVTEPRKAAGALGAAVAEMEKRYHLLAENGVPNIEEYNALAKDNATLQPLPYIVIVIDELADLMMVAGKEVEDYICRIAQKARAAGMHLIIATQRPSVDVITGLIKANIPSRIGLTVMSQIDSRTILDTGGAEKLLGNGDMLYMPVGVNKPIRIQGTFVRSSEIRDVIDFIKKHANANYSEEMIAEMDKCAVKETVAGNSSDDDDEDPMYESAVEAVIDAGQASVSLVQRRCKLGYARAARLIDEMERDMIVGPHEGAKPRKVLITRQEWIEMRMNREAQET